MPAEEISPGELAREWVLHIVIITPLILSCDISFWLRCIADAGSDVQARFKEDLQLFFQAIHIQAMHREGGVILDLETYIDVRRDDGGCKIIFDLIEYSLDINLPDFIIEHPVGLLHLFDILHQSLIR